MTPVLLHNVGAALYGPRWQSELARALGVSDRTVRRWAAGTHPIPAGLYLELLRLCSAREDGLREVVRLLHAEE